MHAVTAVCTIKGVFRVGEFNCASKFFLGPTLVTMVTQILKFKQKTGYNSACMGDRRFLYQTRGNVGLCAILLALQIFV